MDDDLLKLIADEFRELELQADYMGFWPSSFDDRKKEIERKFTQIQDYRIERIILGE